MTAVGTSPCYTPNWLACRHASIPFSGPLPRFLDVGAPWTGPSGKTNLFLKKIFISDGIPEGLPIIFLLPLLIHWGSEEVFFLPTSWSDLHTEPQYWKFIMRGARSNRVTCTLIRRWDARIVPNDVSHLYLTPRPCLVCINLLQSEYYRWAHLWQFQLKIIQFENISLPFVDAWFGDIWSFSGCWWLQCLIRSHTVPFLL